MSDAADARNGVSERRGRDIDVATSLMRMALALLDRAGDPLAAVRLQHAIDTAERRGPGLPTSEDLESFFDREHQRAPTLRQPP